MLSLLLCIVVAQEYEISALWEFSRSFDTDSATTKITLSDMIGWRAFFFLSKKTDVSIECISLTSMNLLSKSEQFFEIGDTTLLKATVSFTEELHVDVIITPITSCIDGAYAHGGGSYSTLDLPYRRVGETTSYCVFAPDNRKEGSQAVTVTIGYTNQYEGESARLHVQGGKYWYCTSGNTCDIHLDNSSYYVEYVKKNSGNLIFQRKNVEENRLTFCMNQEIEYFPSGGDDYPWDFNGGTAKCEGDIKEVVITVAIVVGAFSLLTLLCCCSCGCCISCGIAGCCCNRRNREYNSMSTTSMTSSSVNAYTVPYVYQVPPGYNAQPGL